MVGGFRFKAFDQLTDADTRFTRASRFGRDRDFGSVGGGFAVFELIGGRDAWGLTLALSKALFASLRWRVRWFTLGSFSVVKGHVCGHS